MTVQGQGRTPPGEVALRFRAKLFDRPLSLSELKLEHIDGVVCPKITDEHAPCSAHITPNRRVLLH